MKTIFFGLILLSLNAVAGDLNLVCFKNGDQGDYYTLSNSFMEKNSISTNFSANGKTYVVLVKRDSLFKNYSYEAIIIDNADQSFSKKKFAAKSWDSIINIDTNVQCQVED